jgi:hypothetical protein
MVNAFGCEVGCQGLVEEFCSPVTVECLDIMSMGLFNGCNPIDNDGLGLILGVQRDRPPISGEIINQGEPVAVALDTHCLEWPNKICMDGVQLHQCLGLVG